MGDETHKTIYFGRKLSFILSFLFLNAANAATYIFTARNCITIVNSLEPRAINAEFKHFILSIKRWFHFPCYWDTWVSSISFSFIFYYLCINRYHVLLIFISSLNVCFLLLIACVHSFATFVSHNDSSTNYCTW
jgi:hypothetical protein